MTAPRMLLPRAAAVLVAVCSAFGPLAAGADEPAGADTADRRPRLELPKYPLVADDHFQWTIPIKIVNPTAAGIYNDSVRVEIEDLDPGETRRSRKEVVTMTKVAELVPSISAGDSAIVRYSGPAHAERGRLSLRLYSHAADGRTYVSDGTAEVAPGLVSRSFRSNFLEDKRRRVEYVIVPEAWPPGPSPALLILHGEGSHGRRLLPLAWDLANRGYTAMLVSLPGYGLSTGPADFAGPASVKAVERALDRLRRTTGVDSTRIAVWGVSQGATVAALLAGRRKDLKAVVLQSGIYDLAAAFRATESKELRAALQSDAGPRSGWRRRSPQVMGALPSAPVLILHGERDPVVPATQSVEFAARLRRSGREVSLQLLPDAGHVIPSAEARKAVQAFLKPHLNPSRKVWGE